MPAQKLIPGFKWPISVDRVIPVSAEKLWDVISNPGILEFCHPYCTHNPVHAWPGADSMDEVHYLNGLVFERRLKQWIEGVGYDLEIGERDGKTSSVSWRIAPAHGLKCILTITVYPHLLQNLPVAVRWMPHLLYVRPLLKNYLEAVTQGFAYFSIQGEPVPRDHFGRHPWFSA